MQVSDFLSGRSPLTLALRVGDHMMFVQLQLAAQASGGQPSLSRGPTGPNQTPTGAISSEDPSDFKSRTAPPSSHDRHTHSTQSPAPALHSQRACHTHSTQSPASSPPCVQVRAAPVFSVKLFDSSFIVFIILNPNAKIVNFNRQQ